MTIGSQVTEPPMRAEPLDGIRWRSRRDTAADVIQILLLFGLFAMLDRASRALTLVDGDLLQGPVLIWGAIRSHPWIWLVGAVATLALVMVWPDRAFAPWGALERGSVLRSLALALLVFLVWVGAFYDYNFLVDQLHLVDRLLLAALAVGSWFRPLFLTPFVVQARMISTQFIEPFGSTSARNMDDLLLFALLALAAMHLVFVFTARQKTAPVLLVIFTAVAAHYFVPGRTKLMIDWVTVNDLSNLPLGSHTAGFMAQGDGSWARTASDIIRGVGWPALVGALVVELGSVVAVTHHKLMRVWVVGPILFHTVLFALTGFWFLGWLVLEIALLTILTRPGLRSWVGENSTPARAGIAVVAVVAGGSLLFHPHPLTWYDSPVSYGYRIQATGMSGVVYQVPISAFAPFVQDLSFMRAKLGAVVPAAGGYGYVGSASEYRALQEVDTFEDLHSLERLVDESSLGPGRQLMIRFMEHTNGGDSRTWESLAPPDYFWTGSAEPQFDFQEPLVTLDVLLLRSLHRDGDPVYESDVIMSLRLDERGDPVVTYP